ncbi:MAG: class I SAM-dependent methyltransferase, partial [Gemmatimonadales bacterium]
MIAGVPRILPEPLAATLLVDHPAFFADHPDLKPAGGRTPASVSLRTQRAFGDEWHRFPEVLAVHERIFRWYFEGPGELQWEGLRVLDAGCGMGRWLHFARREGAQVVGMDVSTAIDVAAARDGDGADFVQADLRWPPFASSSFDLVYSFGVIHHLEDPLSGVKSLAALVRPGGGIR